MSQPVRVLIFDDQDSQLQEMMFTLDHLWNNHKLPGGGTLPPLVFTDVSDKRKLQTLLSEPDLASKYDMFICDVLVGEPVSEGVSPNEPAGFLMMSKAKSRGMPLCFAISSGVSRTDAFNRAYEANKKHIDKLFWKTSLQGLAGEEDMNNVVADMVQRLTRKGVLSAVKTQLTSETWVQEARTLGARQDIGDAAFRTFASEFALPNATSVQITSLSPGLSGAKILKLMFKGSEDFGSRRVLLKVSRDRAALAGERQKYADHLLAPDRRVISKVVRPIGGIDKIAEHDAWHAIAFQCAEPALSFNEWLQDPTTTTEMVHAVLENLFNEDGLSDMYTSTAHDGENAAESVASSLLSDYRRMAIVEAMSELKPLAQKYAGDAWVDWGDLSTFVVDSRINGVDSRTDRKPVRNCLTHGDFHGRNLLVVRKGSRFEPSIIDLASMKRAIWCTDVVRLIVDVYLSGWDRGSASYEWTNVAAWVRDIGVVVRSMSGASRDAEEIDGNARVRDALEWIYERRFAIAGLSEDSHRHGEFSLCLAAEFARAAYRVADLTAPKRAFALVAAAALIKDAKSALLREA